MPAFFTADAKHQLVIFNVVLEGIGTCYQRAELFTSVVWVAVDGSA